MDGMNSEIPRRKRYTEPITPGVNPEDLDPEKGLACPRCGCHHFRVIYTRPGARGRIMRRRECRHCGKRLTTMEQSQDAAREPDTT